MTRRTFLGGTGGAILACGWGRGHSAEAPPGESPTAADGATPRPARSDDVVSEEFTVNVGGRKLVPRLVSPRKDRLARKPLLLLNLCADRETALTVEPYCLGVQLFLARGHRALSFDLPNHGQRVDQYGEGIQGWRNAWIQGEDRFRQFVEEASAVVARCLERGLAEPGRVVVYGISRGGYLALRLLAADPRVAAAAAVGPVTDWRELTEFATEKAREDLAGVRLARYAEALVGKRIFMVIGDSDQRVSTRSCCRFFLELVEANVRHGVAVAPIEFHCAPMSEPGHTVDDVWRVRAAEFLLRTQR